MTFDVPANILLTGEYLVTLEGGIGVWVAIDSRARCTMNQGGSSFVALDTSNRPQSLPNLCHDYFEKMVRETNPTFRLPNCELIIDTKKFYDEKGQKIGFGSSAAVVVLVMGAMAELAKSQGLEISSKDLIQWSIEAHRLFQNGRGSGYDICASFFGGFGRFVGGLRPLAEPFGTKLELGLDCYRGNIPVSSASAIAHFFSFSQDHEAVCKSWFAKSNEISKKLEAALKEDSLELFQKAFADGRTLGLEIGSAIGVDAQVPEPFKAVGAGNELGVSIAKVGSFQIDYQGFRKIAD